MHLLAAGVRPRQILTRGAFESAIAVVMALGGAGRGTLLLCLGNGFLAKYARLVGSASHGALVGHDGTVGPDLSADS